MVASSLTNTLFSLFVATTTNESDPSSTTTTSTTSKRDFTPNVDWESGNNLDHFQRALVVVCFFIFSPIVAILFKTLFLKLARVLGLQRWVTITEILRRYENFNKVVMNTKLILNKQSPTSPSDNVCGMRNVHFFSDSDKELLKFKKTKNKLFRGDLNNDDGGSGSILKDNSDAYMVCPHNIEIHNGDTILEEQSIKTILLRQHCQKKAKKMDDEYPSSFTTRRKPLAKNFGFDYNHEGDTDTYFTFEEEEEEEEKEEEEMKRREEENLENDLCEKMRIEKRFKQEVRPFMSFLRGNFITFLASIISLVILLVGWIIGLALLGISFTSTINGSTFLLGVTLFKIADSLKGIVCYFSLLVNDTFERGDIIEVYGPYGFTGGSVVGCVYDITLSSVKLVTFKPYQLFPLSSARLDMAIREVAALQKKEAAAAATAATTSSNNSSAYKEREIEPKNLQPKLKTVNFMGEVESSPTVTITKEKKQQQHYENIQYIEKPQRAIAYLVNIPTTLFYDVVTNRHVFWEKKIVCHPTPKQKQH